MTNYSSIFAWRIPWTEGPSRLQWGHKESDVTERLTLLPIGSDGPFQVLLVVKNLPANTKDVRDVGTIPGSGRSPGGGHGNPLQYCCLENPMDRGTWEAIVHWVTKSEMTELTVHTKWDQMP